VADRSAPRPANPAAPRPAFARESAAVRLSEVVSLADLSPEWAWGGATGRGVRVAVVDSGIEAGHPSLEGCVDEEHGLTVTLDEAGQAVDMPGPHDDSFGHGTAVAGIIHSIAPEARITSVKVLGAGLAGKAAAFLRGLGWAVEQGFDVVNLSLGTTKRDWLYASVTSVACNLATDPFRFQYNPEPPTEFLARGIDVEVPWVGGSSIRGTGNSYAAPHISGIAALVRSKHPELRPFQVKTVLWAVAANVREAPQPAGRLSRSMRMRTASTRASAALRAPVHPDAPPSR
jgi:subtilisin